MYMYMYMCVYLIDLQVRIARVVKLFLDVHVAVPTVMMNCTKPMDFIPQKTF